MPWKYTKQVLHTLANLYKTKPETLTTHEQDICKRICTCANCGHIWLAQRGSKPKRCEKCKSSTWNTPTINALAQNEPQTQPTNTNHHPEED